MYKVYDELVNLNFFSFLIDLYTQLWWFALLNGSVHKLLLYQAAPLNVAFAPFAPFRCL